MEKPPYIFTSERLGFRNWMDRDLDTLSKINDDNDVMKFFPAKPSRSETKEFITRMQQMYTEKNFCYFAVDILETQQCIGFIGLCEQNYHKKLGTFVDIGWRLKKSNWFKGYATEGAKACLRYGFEHIGLREIYSVAPKVNIPSESVMKKIGMQYQNTFVHPKLLEFATLKECVLYKISNSTSRS